MTNPQWITSVTFSVPAVFPGEESPRLQRPPAQDRGWGLGVERRRAGRGQWGGQGSCESGQGRWDSTKTSLWPVSNAFYNNESRLCSRLSSVCMKVQHYCCTSCLTCRPNCYVTFPLSLTLYIPSPPDQSVFVYSRWLISERACHEVAVMSWKTL